MNSLTIFTIFDFMQSSSILLLLYNKKSLKSFTYIKTQKNNYHIKIHEGGDDELTFSITLRVARSCEHGWSCDISTRTFFGGISFFSQVRIPIWLKMFLQRVTLIFLLFFTLHHVYCRPGFYDVRVDEEDTPSPVTVSVVYDQHSKALVLKNGIVKPYVAKAAFKKTMNNTGYDFYLIFLSIFIALICESRLVVLTSMSEFVSQMQSSCLVADFSSKLTSETPQWFSSNIFSSTVGR